MSNTLFFLFLSLLFGSVASSSKRGLVLLDDDMEASSYSSFFDSVEKLGWELEFRSATESDLKLETFGQYLYESLIIFAPTTEEFGGEVDVDAILNFIDSGHNVLIATDTEVSEVLREVATECGVEIAPDDTNAIDHVNFDTSDFGGDHTLLVLEASNAVSSKIITGEIGSPLLFKGIAQTVDEDGSAFAILSGSSSSYSFSPSEVVTEEPHVAGKDVVLISGLQGLNNARVTISGSLQFFSNEFFTSSVQAQGSNKQHPVSGNQDFARNLVSWTFGERGLLRTSNIQHHLVGETEPKGMYTVKEEVFYSIDIEELVGDEWVPYEDSNIQVEFVMLDPYVRLFLKSEAGSKTFSTQFQIPDVYGMYTFRINYVRAGYTFLKERTIVTVRPLRHNQFERFIPAAFPYYASAFSMMAGLLAFSFVFLFSKN